MWVGNLGKDQLDDTSLPHGFMDVIQWHRPADGLVWRVQDGFAHISDALMSGTLDSARTIDPVVSPACRSKSDWTFYMVAQREYSKRPKWELKVINDLP